MNKTSNKYFIFLIYLALALTTLAVFWQLRSYDFVNYDDPAYVTGNRYVKAGLTRDGLIWAFTTGYRSNWHPLTWLSLMLDCQLSESSPGFHHMTNLFLHITSTLLLFGFLNRITGALWRSVFVAAAFALHPLHVESVAWISQRKDVLSTVFWFLTMIAYLHYVRRPGLGRYLLTLLAFALGLMAKPMLVTVPFVLLLLDYWPLERFHLTLPPDSADENLHHIPDARSKLVVLYRLVREKVPFFALSAASGIVTFLVQRSGGAVVTITSFPLNSRIANALFSYLRYIGKMFWPQRLAVFYPHTPDAASITSQAIAAALLLLAVSICVIRFARRHKYLPMGWFWFLGTLVPVIGLLQVGEQSIADRYTYVPLTGLFIIIAWGLPELLARWRYQKVTLAASMLAVLLALAICTRFQLRHWRSSITLFEHTLDVTTEDNYVAHFALAGALYEQGKIPQSLAHSAQVLRIKPNHTLAHYGHALSLLRLGEYSEASTHFERAIRISRGFADAHYQLGALLHRQGKTDRAIVEYRRTLQIDPNHSDARQALQILLKTLSNENKK